LLSQKIVIIVLRGRDDIKVRALSMAKDSASKIWVKAGNRQLLEKISFDERNSKQQTPLPTP